MPPTDSESLERSVRNGARWFFWIALLSLVNTAMFLFGSTTAFVMGLVATQVVDGVAVAAIQQGAPGALKFIAIGVDLLIAGVFLGFGLYAGRKRRWAFVAGMILYFLDAMLAVALADWMSLAFHGLALVFLQAGLSALGRLTAAPVAPTPAA